VVPLKASCMNRWAVLLFPHLGVAGQEDAGRSVYQEDGHQVVVGFTEELARQ
jgi:hypothetical protein